MGVALTVVAKETIESLLVRRARCVRRTQPPFSESAGGITVLLEDFGNGRNLIGNRPLPRKDATVSGISVPSNLGVCQTLARHQDTSRRCAHGCTCVVLEKPNALACKSIDVGCANFLLAVATQFAVAQVIGHDKHNVRFSVPRLASLGSVASLPEPKSAKNATDHMANRKCSDLDEKRIFENNVCQRMIHTLGGCELRL